MGQPMPLLKCRIGHSAKNLTIYLKDHLNGPVGTVLSRVGHPAEVHTGRLGHPGFRVGHPAGVPRPAGPAGPVFNEPGGPVGLNDLSQKPSEWSSRYRIHSRVGHPALAHKFRLDHSGSRTSAGWAIRHSCKCRLGQPAPFPLRRVGQSDACECVGWVSRCPRRRRVAHPAP